MPAYLLRSPSAGPALTDAGAASWGAGDGGARHGAQPVAPGKQTGGDAALPAGFFLRRSAPCLLAPTCSKAPLLLGPSTFGSSFCPTPWCRLPGPASAGAPVPHAMRRRTCPIRHPSIPVPNPLPPSTSPLPRQRRRTCSAGGAARRRPLWTVARGGSAPARPRTASTPAPTP